MSWTGNNTTYSESARAAALGLLNSVGQCLAIAASFLYVSLSPIRPNPTDINNLTADD
jgi:hypothetical protein